MARRVRAAAAWHLPQADADGLGLRAAAGPVCLDIEIDLEARPTRNELEVAAIAAATTHLAVRGLRRQPAYPGLPQLLDAFYRALEQGRQPPISSAEMIAAAELMERFGSGASNH